MVWNLGSGCLLNQYIFQMQLLFFQAVDQVFIRMRAIVFAFDLHVEFGMFSLQCNHMTCVHRDLLFSLD